MKMYYDTEKLIELLKVPEGEVDIIEYDELMGLLDHAEVDHEDCEECNV